MKQKEAPTLSDQLTHEIGY